MQQPSSSSTTTTTEMWQWHCGTCRADWKMLRQVTTTTCCPHGYGGRRCCFQGHATPPLPSPSARNPAPHCHRHHQHHRQEGSNAGPGRDTTITTLNPAPPVVAEVCWVPEPYLMVQQLRELESLDCELVALRVQLQEYAEEILKSSRDINAGMNMNWLIDLPPNVRDVVILARDVIESFIAISSSAPPAN